MHTNNTDWDPTWMDHTLSGDENWYNNIKDLYNGLIQTPFDEYGNYRHCQLVSAPAPTPPDPTIPEPTTNPVDISASADTNHYAKANLYEVFCAASHLNHC